MPKDTGWGAIATWYDELLEESPDSFQAKVILPNLLRILGLDTKNKNNAQLKMIDIACGQGYFSRALAAAGAYVTSADISSELISKAKERSPKEIAFH